MSRWMLWVCCCAVGLLGLGWASSAQAFQRYNDGCNGCHGHFDNFDPYTSPRPGGTTWPGSLHIVHRDAAFMNTDCDNCHSSGDGRNPYLKTSNAGFGCSGCHMGDGLRAHHIAKGKQCGVGTCHGTPNPEPESTLPPYYGSSTTLANYPCNDDANTSEDWSGDGVGLDNDGDGLYDADDPDCASAPVCGNGVPESGELCDPCPTTCDDSNACTADVMSGSPSNCDVQCSYTDITACNGGDGCCPSGCNETTDSDCDPVCGNDVLETGETCDPISNCPTTCDDGDACTTDTLQGDASTCDAQCITSPITTCTSDDGCCPSGCNANNDNDCAPACDNGVLEAGETCDPISNCPTSCNDNNACTADALIGDAASCTAECTFTNITACNGGDGCCPSSCNSSNDSDCAAVCGNGVVETGETCDPISSCPTSCDDGDACTTDTLQGDASTCDALCVTAVIDTCIDADGCCPSGCDQTTDSDCSAVCDNGVLEAGEICDPISTCPTSCNDNDACTADVLSGSPSACTAQCTFTPISTCTGGDGCCPSGCNANGDSDCNPVCDNGAVESGETCDPISSCPTTCDDGNACTTDTMSGSAATCDATCSHTAVTACRNNDGCCPTGCATNRDNDCSASCGDGNVDPGETCDPPSSCPTSCDDNNACTTDTTSGSAANCNVVCGHTNITACTGGDGCCPSGCNANIDSDCAPSCGNGVVESGEACDPVSACPTSCNDGNACTTDILTGDAAQCTAQCSYTTITACSNGDGCCPSGCNANDDDDCSATCGNSVVEPGETCDPPGDCPTSCSDGNACTTDTLTGSAANCNVACTYPPVTACTASDGCCPSGCNANVDDDCSPSCDNGVVEAGETCDPISDCPTSCDDGNACTADSLTGSASTCNAVCNSQPIVSCDNGDGCCPNGCNANTDDDCSASCGNGVVESGETCDPVSSCPTACDDGNACTVDSLTGSSANCNAACSHQDIVSCADGDGCCPSGCDATSDTDCSPSCDNGVIEAGETCDPISTCPTTCDDSNACTNDSLTGSAANCNAACSNQAIVSCADGDGCCPNGCDATTDTDCSSTCDNGVLEPGETCDPVSSCPVDCDDADACTVDTMTGSAANCSATCSNQAIVSCADGDGCCPSGCDASVDDDCGGAGGAGGWAGAGGLAGFAGAGGWAGAGGLAGTAGTAGSAAMGGAAGGGLGGTGATGGSAASAGAAAMGGDSDAGLDDGGSGSPGAAPSTEDEGGCGCSLPGRSAGSGLVLLGALGLVALSRRRRRR